MLLNKTLLARLLIGLVTAWNLLAAVTFILWPASYVAAYELSGVPGETAVRGVGVLFLMWNVPYVVALWHPIRYRLALVLALIMQFIGLAGEIFILSNLSLDHAILRASILRFIAFDAAGLILLLIAYVLVMPGREATQR
jgi:hypothetical protein